MTLEASQGSAVPSLIAILHVLMFERKVRDEHCQRYTLRLLSIGLSGSSIEDVYDFEENGKCF